MGLKRAAAVFEYSKQHKYISSSEQHGLPLVMESVRFVAGIGWFGLRFKLFPCALLCSVQPFLVQTNYRTRENHKMLRFGEGRTIVNVTMRSEGCRFHSQAPGPF